MTIIIIIIHIIHFHFLFRCVFYILDLDLGTIILVCPMNGHKWMHERKLDGFNPEWSGLSISVCVCVFNYVRSFDCH